MHKRWNYTIVLNYIAVDLGLSFKCVWFWGICDYEINSNIKGQNKQLHFKLTIILFGESVVIAKQFNGSI